MRAEKDLYGWSERSLPRLCPGVEAIDRRVWGPGRVSFGSGLDLQSKKRPELQRRQ